MRLRQQKIFFTHPDIPTDKDVENLKCIFYVEMLRNYQVEYRVDLFRYIDDRDGRILRKNVRVTKYNIEKFKKDYPECRGVMKGR